MLGVVIIGGHALGFAVVAIATFLYWLKACDEERMIQAFSRYLSVPPGARQSAGAVPILRLADSWPKRNSIDHGRGCHESVL